MIAAKLLGGFHSVLLSLIAIRQMEPANFGGFAFGLTVVTIVDGVLGSAVDVGVLRRLSELNPDKNPDRTEVAGAAIKLIAGLAFLLISLLFGGHAAGVILNRPSPSFFPVIALVVCSLFLFRSLQVYYQGRHEYRRFAALELAHVLGRCALVIGYLLTANSQPEPALALFTIPPLLLTGIAGVWLFRPRTWRSLDRASVRSLAIFVRETMAATATGAVSSRLDVLSAGWLTSAADLGRFTAATTVAQIPEIAATYLSGAFAPSILPRLRSGTFLQWFRKITIAGVVTCVIGVAGIPLAVWGITQIFPSKYDQAAELIRILGPGYLASALIFPVALNLLLFRAPRVFVRYDLIVLPFLLTAYYWWGSRFGVAGIAWVSVISRIAKSAVIHGIAFRIAAREERDVRETGTVL